MYITPRKSQGEGAEVVTNSALEKVIWLMFFGGELHFHAHGGNVFIFLCFGAVSEKARERLWGVSLLWIGGAAPSLCVKPGSHPLPGRALLWLVGPWAGCPCPHCRHRGSTCGRLCGGARMQEMVWRSPGRWGLLTFPGWSGPLKTCFGPISLIQ